MVFRRDKIQTFVSLQPSPLGCAAKVQCPALLCGWNRAFAPALVWPPQAVSVFNSWFAGGPMKRLWWILMVLALNGGLDAQTANVSQTQERMFLPRDTFWGYAQFDLAPPHNEIDPNICAGNAGQ